MKTTTESTGADGLTELRRALRVAVIAYVGSALAAFPRRLLMRCEGHHCCCRQ